MGLLFRLSAKYELLKVGYLNLLEAYYYGRLVGMNYWTLDILIYYVLIILILWFVWFPDSLIPLIVWLSDSSDCLICGLSDSSDSLILLIVWFFWFFWFQQISNQKNGSAAILAAEAIQGELRTNHHARDSERKGRIGLDCLSINPKRARMGSLLVLDCTLYILEYMWAAWGYL